MLSGSFRWLILSTPDPEGAGRFYRQLLGWDLRDGPATALERDGKRVGYIMNRADDERARKRPPNWLPVVGVRDVAGTLEAAASLGGAVVEDVQVPGGPRIDRIQAPTGEVFGVWKIPNDDREPLVEDAGTAWIELVTPDPERASPFYERLFNWRFTQEGSYTLLTHGGEPIGGTLRMSGDWEDHAFLSAIGQAPGRKWEIPPHWMTFFAVADCDDTLKIAKGLGGRIRARTDRLHTIGRFAQLLDPHGAYFCVLDRG